MAAQASISARRLRARTGRELDVLIDTVEDGVAIARSSADAPEIDGVVRIVDGADAVPGSFARVRVVQTGEHDLHATLVD